MAEIQDKNLKNDTFNQVSYKNKAIPVPTPDKISDIDTNGDFFDYIIDSADNSTLDISKIDSFTTISNSRNEVYNLLDTMAEDPTIAAALNIYSADICEPNDQGRVVWPESPDEKVMTRVNNILDSLNIDKKSHDWVYSLCKYGDLYLRLYRQSDFKIFDRAMSRFKNKEKDQLNEEVIINAYGANDRYAQYIEIIKNPAEVFNLTKFGKSYGFLQTKVNSNIRRKDMTLQPTLEAQMSYRFNSDDVNVYDATEFVHASLSDNSDRTSEEVSLTSGNMSDKDDITFTVKRGQSLLYNSYKIWRELSLLENAVLLNRVTKSSVLRIVNVDTGNVMDPSQIKNLLHRVKMMFEQKTSFNQDVSMGNYTNPGPIENTIYVPVHDQKGSIEVKTDGGNPETGDLNDLDWWRKKLFASLGIPGQFLGDTSDSAGFNGGSSLSLISSRYAKTVKSIQNTYLQAITDAVNLILLDSGEKDYINKFTLRMQVPATQEEKDRKDNISNSINNIQNITNLLGDVEPSARLEVVKSLLSNVVNNPEVNQILQDEIDRMKEDSDHESVESESIDEYSSLEDLPSVSEIDDSGEIQSTEMELPEEPNEQFYQDNGGKLLTEEDYLPTWTELGVSYNEH